MSQIIPYGKENPFLASLKERRWLSKPGSGKNTYHIVLDLHGSGYTYQAGDSIGIFPEATTTNVPTILRTIL